MAVATLEQMDAKIEELREATRLANAALKDLKTARKEAIAETERQAEHWKEQIKEIIVDYVKAELNSLGDMFGKAEKDLSDKFFRHFDELIKNIFEGQEGVSLTELAKRRNKYMDKLMQQRMIDGTTPR
jgi:F0F1-type ATP synthase membrane subunit b/b'